MFVFLFNISCFCDRMSNFQMRFTQTGRPTCVALDLVAPSPSIVIYHDGFLFYLPVQEQYL